MPLLDHFAPPLAGARHWESFHGGWAEALAERLNERLPPGFVAESVVHYGPRVEVDVATFDRRAPDPIAPETREAMPAFRPEPPEGRVAVTFPDEFETLVHSTAGGQTELVAAIELVSPSNEDRPATRRQFVGKCLGYLLRGMGLVVVDVVTSRRTVLHDEMLDSLEAGDALRLGSEAGLWAAAYRPLRRESGDETEIWVERLEIGKPLPENLPLWIDAATAVPVELETAYRATCRRRRIDLDRLAAEAVRKP